jgi:NAD(P)-dependent dehydrogenase (short-subunit alcohol dehydrogenase family)
MQFQDKVVVITGAGGNFGREGCFYFAQRGAKVAALDLNPTALEETAKFVHEKTSCEIFVASCDVTETSSVQEAMDSIVKKFGRVDLLWNNAGYQGQIKPTLDYDPKDFALVMNINVTGMFIVLQAVARQMVKQGPSTQKGGYSIVNTSSVAGLRGTPAMVAYASSKAAVLSMTVSTSKDLAPNGIRVNAISPALIGPGYMWDRQNELHAQSGSPYFATDPETVAQNKISGVPMKRLGSVEEVIQSVAFLLSEEASYTTGTNLVVDGGMSSGLRC